jgi:hypothetical protein
MYQLLVIHIKRIKQILFSPQYSTVISGNCIQWLKRKFVSKFSISCPWKIGCPLERILALSIFLDLYYKYQQLYAA